MSTRTTSSLLKMIRTITLSDGKKIPAMGWGNGTAGLGHSGSKAITKGEYALRQGVRHIDTAQMYGSETETGMAIKQAEVARADIWVTSKRACIPCHVLCADVAKTDLCYLPTSVR